MSRGAAAAPDVGLFDALGDAVLVTDADGVIVSVNATLLHMTGFERPELVGRRPNVLKSGAHPESFYREMWGTLTAGRVWRGVISNRRKDGGTFQCEETISAWLGAGGEFRGYVAVMRDVSERLALERAARESAEVAARSESLLRRILDVLPVGVRVVDARGDSVYLNPEARRILGGDIPVSGGVVALRGVWSESGAAVAPEEWPLTRAFRARAPQLHRAIVLHSADGVERSVLASAFPALSPDGEVENVFSFFQDVSELRELREALSTAESSLQRTQRLEMVGRLAAGVSHDFNNALSIIAGYADMVRQALPPGHGALSDVLEIARAAARAKGLASQLLAFGRQQVLAPEPIAVDALVADVGRLLKGFLGVRILVETKVECPPGRTVFADRCQLENALVNLAINSRDAMPGGGTLVLRAADAAARPGRDGATVCLSVTDDGTGIPAEVLPRVFEPFFTTKAPGQGTGLGLATVFGFARQSGGDLSIANRPEGGVKAVLLLPSGPPRSDDGAEAVPAEAAPPARDREKILLVDDEGALVSVVRRMLTAGGYEVVVCGPLNAADLPQAELDGVSLLLCDVCMPSLPGPRLAERLRRRRAGLRVLYMSGHLEEILSGEFKDSPRGAFLHKPFSRPDLLKAVRGAIDSPER